MPQSVFYLLLLLVSLQANAEPVQLQVSDRLTANAEFRAGDSDKPVLLLLHGFLQTHQFHTIHQLTESLGDEGYSILAPTITLSVPFRSKSLACESIHNHTLEDAYGEIDAWIDWLDTKGLHQVVLIGHSTGSMTLIGYLSKDPRPQVKRFIGISAVETRMEMPSEKQQTLIADLRDKVARHDNHLIKNQFSFCNPITISPKSLLSYLEWSPDRILQGIHDIALPTLIIMGSKDERLGPNWISKLKTTGKRINIIDGANHFIDGEHEFELVDLISAELSSR
jgi:pimeloyl-ACP methyl ester carboxylesterase